MKIKILVPQEIEIDESKLADYAQEVRTRFETEADSTVGMFDLIAQAGIDGDVELPDEWLLEDDENLTDEEIAEIMAG